MKYQLHSCHICKKNEAYSIDDFKSLNRITSDCKYWPSGGNIGVCLNCGTVQKYINNHWKQEVMQIYSTYNIYHQSKNNSEQPVFEQTSGEANPRSKKILKFLAMLTNLPTNGSMLDIGCGTGVTLKAFSDLFPNWELNGFEPNLKHPEKIFNIPGVKHIFTEDLNHIKTNFDLISVIHTLEHIEEPLPFLTIIRNKLTIDGILLIEVPYFLDNPFDLLVTDHCSHFTIPTLLMLLKNAGLKVISIKTDVIEKELIVVSRLSNLIKQNLKIDHKIILQNINYTKNCINWIKFVLLDAYTIAKNTNNLLGIFGTSIAATWLLAEIKNYVKFFVEEDQSRVGKLYYDLPVYNPTSTPKNSHIYIIFPRKIAEKIACRLKKEYPHFNCHIPPKYSYSKIFLI